MQSLVFFGSFQSYSVQVLEKLTRNFSVLAVVTTPPSPKGRHLDLISTEVATYSKNHNIPLLELNTLEDIPAISQPDFLVVAGYGKLLPDSWLAWPKIFPINMHPSLLPKYRGRCPAEWAILNGETQTGVTLITMTSDFDRGDVLAQATLPIDPTDTRESLYGKLYTLGADLLVSTLPGIATGKIHPRPQTQTATFYARQTTREDGFLPWSDFSDMLNGLDPKLIRLHRALSGWPGVWTTNPSGHRLKLISLSPTVLVQKPGKTPQTWPI